MMLRPGLKLKLSVVVTVLFSLFFAVMIVTSLSYFEREFRDNISAQQFNLVTSLARGVDDKILSAQTELTSVAKRFPMHIIGSPARAQQFLDNRLDTQLIFDNGIFLFSPSGRMIAGTAVTPDVLKRNFAFRDYFKQTMSTARPYISDPFLSKQTHGHPIIMLTAPVFDAQGNVVAVFAGSLDLLKDNFLGALPAIKIGRTGSLYLYSTDRTIIASADKTRTMKKDVPLGANLLFDKAIEGFEGTGITITSKGTEVLASFKRLQSVNWILAANYPAAEAFEPINRARRYFLLAALLGIAVTTVVVWFVMGYLTKPLKIFTAHVSSAAEKTGAGKFVHIRSGDEIEVLADSYNRMIAALDKNSEHLQQSEAGLAKAQRIARIGSWDWDREKNELRWSEESYRIFGLRKDEFGSTYESFLNAVHGEDRESVARATEAALSGKRPYSIDYRIVLPDGAVRHVHEQGEVVLNSAGDAVGMTGTVQDITDCMRIETSLRESEDKFKTIAEHSGVGIFLVQDGAFKYVNPRIAATMGCTPGEIVETMTPRDIVLPEDWPLVGTNMVKRLAGKAAPDHYEFRILTKRGDIVHVENHASLISYRGRPAIMASLLDITERKTAEQAVQESDKRLKAFIEANPDGVYFSDREGVFQRINRAGAKILGHGAPQEVIGRKAIDFWADPAERDRFLSDLREKGSVKGFTMRGRRADGSRIYLEATSRLVLDEGGNISGIEGILRDITDRTLAEMGLAEKTRELESAYRELKAAQSRVLQQEKMASIGQLAAGVAHEINNPTGFVISNLGTLDKYVGRMKEYLAAQAALIGPMSGTAQGAALLELGKRIKIDYVMADAPQLLRESLDGANRIKDIVQNLKSFSRMNNAELEPADINAGLESTIVIAWNELKYKATVKKEYGDIPPLICNLGQLNQVFMNLLVNAAQAIETRGEITVRTGRENGSVFVSVSDTGCGIAEENLARIFDPFFTTKEVGKGTGLGLSIAYDIVKKHKGDISVQSEAGKGTTFTVRIPVVREEEPCLLT